MRIRLTRNRQVTPPASGLELDTGGNPLPCSLLGIVLDEVKPLGPRSSFCGHVWANQTPGGWAAQIEGRLQGLDLAALLSRRLPHTLTGPAELSIESARLWQGRVEQAAGTLRAGPGLVGSALVRGAVRQLHLVSTAEPAVSGDLGYEQLALDFQVDAGGRAASGLLPRSGGRNGADDAQRAAVGRAHRRAAAGGSPDPGPGPRGEVQVPATPEAEWLARWLPLPEAAASRPRPPCPAPGPASLGPAAAIASLPELPFTPAAVSAIVRA